MSRNRLRPRLQLQLSNQPQHKEWDGVAKREKSCSEGGGDVVLQAFLGRSDRSVMGIKRASKIPHTVIVITPNGQSVGSNIVQVVDQVFGLQD